MPSAILAICTVTACCACARASAPYGGLQPQGKTAAAPYSRWVIQAGRRSDRADRAHEESGGSVAPRPHGACNSKPSSAGEPPSRDVGAETSVFVPPLGQPLDWSGRRETGESAGMTPVFGTRLQHIPLAIDLQPMQTAGSGSLTARESRQISGSRHRVTSFRPKDVGCTGFAGFAYSTAVRANRDHSLFTSLAR
jgi:hypothetical protein